MYSVKKINCLIFVALTNFTGNLAHAQEGVWLDSATGLSWMRCSIGQKWTGKTCKGKPLNFAWRDALDFVSALNRDGGFASRTDWRVPTFEELSTIRVCSKGWKRETTGYKTKTTVEGNEGYIKTITLPNGKSVPESCADRSSGPTLNTAIFPSTEESFYWSSSPDTDNNYHVWIVDFGYGSGFTNGNDGGGRVRLVRSSQ